MSFGINQIKFTNEQGFIGRFDFGHETDWLLVQVFHQIEIYTQCQIKGIKIDKRSKNLS
jgi:hypothetical protein